MQIAKESITIQCSKEHIWDIYTDIKNWNKWDEAVEYSCRIGEIVPGSTGKLKPKNGPESKTQITIVEKYNRLQDVSFLPFAQIIFDHQIKEVSGGVSVTHIIEIEGLFSFLFKLILGNNLRKGLHNALPNLKKYAEKK